MRTPGSRVLLALVVCACACRAAGPAPGPYQPLSEATRSSVIAEDLNREAADLIYEDPKEAERLLREALTADLYFGPAHNNLGVLYLEQGKLYEAANEFEWARKLMPGKPDPRMNLAYTLEVAGCVEDALREYETALEVDPEHVPTMQAVARLLMRRNRGDERLPGLLEAVAMRGSSPEWRAWALEARTKEIHRRP